MADVAQDLDVRNDDLVVIRLTLRGRDGGEAVTLNESVSVADLPGALEGDGGGEVPAFDNEAYATQMAEATPASIEKALQLMADFQEATAEFVAGGGVPPAERLADAVVNWVLETQPKGHNYTNDADSNEGYIISKNEINIAGPLEMNGERFWRVTAVGTWG
jgi:hypothetical protein